jgi:hypothetical protein
MGCAWVAPGSTLGFPWRYAALMVLLPWAVIRARCLRPPCSCAVGGRSLSTVGLMMQGAGSQVVPQTLAALAQHRS